MTSPKARALQGLEILSTSTINIVKRRASSKRRTENGEIDAAKEICQSGLTHMGIDAFPLQREWSRGDHELAFIVAPSSLASAEGSFFAKEQQNEELFDENLLAKTGPWWICSPHARHRLAWDMAGIAVIGWDLVVIPLGVFQLPKSDLLDIMGFVTLFFWSFDMLFSMTTGFYRKPGQCEETALHEVLEMQPRRILRHYFRTSFPLDVFVVGIDWLVLVIGATDFGKANQGGLESAGIARVSKLIRILRILRTLRLLRLAKLRTLFYHLQEMVDCESISVIVNMVKNVLCILVVNHVIACVWYLIGISVKDQPTWVEVHRLRPEDADFYYRYATALHWSLTQFTPASMHVQPQNTTERFFAVIVLLFAMIVFSSFVSSITAAMTNLRNISGKQAQQLFLLRKYLKQTHVSKDLSARVIRYILLVVAEKKKHITENSVDLLKLASRHLISQLKVEMYMPHMEWHPFFRQLYLETPNVSRRLCAVATRWESLSQCDILFHKGEPAAEMCIVRQGKLLYRHSSEGDSVPVEAGVWICEAILWLEWSHQGDMLASTDSQLIAVDSSKFRETLVNHCSAHMVSYSVLYARNFRKKLCLQERAEPFVSDIQMELPFQCHLTTISDIRLSECLAKRVVNVLSHRVHHKPDAESGNMISGVVSVVVDSGLAFVKKSFSKSTIFGSADQPSGSGSSSSL